MKKLLVRFENTKNNYLLVISETGKYLGKLHTNLVPLIWTEDDIIEEDEYLYFWCHKDLLEQYLLK